MSAFLLAICQPGFEKILKKEVEARFPDARFSFSRPGLVTFKRLDKEWTIQDTAIDLVWARLLALSGRMVSWNELIENHQRKDTGENPRITVFSRDPELPLPPETLSSIHDIASDFEHLFIQVDAGKWIAGYRKTSSKDWPLAGGFLFPLQSDDQKSAHIPSRAYYKMKEALWRSGFQLTAGQVVIEVGSAPGGATLALLETGASVIGIDPGQMSETVLANSNLQWISKPILEVTETEIPKKVALWVLDVNVAPQAALSAIEPWVRKLRRPTVGVVFTLKMNELNFTDDLERFKKRVEEWGMRDVMLKHLPSNRQEVCLWGRSTRFY